MSYGLLVLLHVIGVTVGAGGAFVSDFLFFASAKDRKIDKSEAELLSVTSRVIWYGLAILYITGFLMLYQTDFARLSMPGFQAKLTLVVLLTINGLIFHYIHLPFIQKRAKAKSAKITQQDEQRFAFMFANGSISMVSWLAVIIIGVTSATSLSYGAIMGMYLAVLSVVFLAAQLIRYIMFMTLGGNKAKSNGHEHRANILFAIGIAAALVVSITALVGRTDGKSIVIEEKPSLPVLTPKSELLPAPITERHVSYAPEVPAPANRTDQRIFDVHLEVIENVCTIDAENGIKIDMWGYRIDGDDQVFCGAPGPVLRGRVGDVARITLTNLPSNKHPHNIDFHSVTGQGGGAKDLTVAPGETATIEARLLYPGAFMYHCAYGDVPEHIMRGMYGMFIVDPEEPLEPVAHEWAVMQNEWYTTEPDEDGLVQHDRQALSDETPNYVVFNGRVGSLTGEDELQMKVGERARIYFVNEGLNLASNFHPIGSHWDKVYPEGATHPSNNTIHGSQSTLVVAGGGSVVELVAQLPTKILLVDHALSRTFYKGALGIINVTGSHNNELFEVVKAAEGGAADHNHEDHEEEDGDLVEVSIPKGAGDRANADRAYLPREITVEVGTTVKWTNDDVMMHTVTSGTAENEIRNPDGLFDSGYMRPGATFSYEFNEPGEYPYYCTPHPFATGVVIVE